MKINICGIKYKIKEKDVINEGDEGIVQGRIEYSKQKIFLKKNLPEQTKEETLVHEIVHGILLHTGWIDLTSNEQFVQSLANAIYQSFKIRKN